MNPFEIPGAASDTALRFAHGHDDSVILSVCSTGHDDSVVLRPEWLRPLAAWLDGEAQPGIHGNDGFDAQYGRWLAIAGDTAAVAFSTHTWVKLCCELPFGAARVTVGTRGQGCGWTVMVSPGSRAEAAAWLRRLDAHSWARPQTTV